MSTLSRVKSIIDQGAFNEFLGMEEDLWLEVKGSNPYGNFETAKQRCELAKDVSAFANSEGGYLVIGLTQQPEADKNTVKITGLDLLPVTNFDARKYEGLIRDSVYPKMEGLEVGWKPLAENGTVGVGYVHVPPQEEARKFFLMKKIVEGEEELKQIVFGVARRFESDNDSLNYDQLYAILKKGKSEDREILSRIESKIDRIATKKVEDPPRRLQSMISEQIRKRLGL